MRVLSLFCGQVNYRCGIRPGFALDGTEEYRDIPCRERQQAALQGIASVHSDASSFEPPLGNLVVYFYNPFLKDLMTKVLENLASVAGNNRSKVALIYFNPLSSDVVEGCGMFVRRQEIMLPYDYSREQQRKCFVYFN